MSVMLLPWVGEEGVLPYHTLHLPMVAILPGYIPQCASLGPPHHGRCDVICPTCHAGAR